MQDTLCLYRVPVTSVYSREFLDTWSARPERSLLSSSPLVRIPVAPPPPTEMWVKLDCVRTVFMFGELGLTNKTARLVLTIHSLRSTAAAVSAATAGDNPLWLLDTYTVVFTGGVRAH